ncbi:MAG: hypothetical protein ABL903_03000 [Methylococcales bacterium]
MSIQKEFVVRYRSIGHVRFQIPAQVCVFPVASAIEDGIMAIAGVTSVRLFSKQQKLSIRFDEAVCNFNRLALKIVVLLGDLNKRGGLAGKMASKAEPNSNLLTKMGNKVKGLKASQWIKGKVDDAKETVQAAKVITKLGMKRPKSFIQNPEKAIINFLNDILVLYLIKIHWKHVVKLWLPSPLKYRYEWLTVLYLFYLLVRSRKSAQ